MSARPTVTVVIPTFNEERHLGATLESVRGQTYDGDRRGASSPTGGRRIATRDVALEFSGVRVVDNPARERRAAGLNRALESRAWRDRRARRRTLRARRRLRRALRRRARGNRRGDGRWRDDARAGRRECHAARHRVRDGESVSGRVPPDSTSGDSPAGSTRCTSVHSAPTTPAPSVATPRTSGSTRTPSSRSACAAHGGVWFDPRIRSVYVPRSTVAALAKQFYRYGRSRALTARRHPREVRLRQLAAPALVLGMLSGRRRQIAVAYAAVVLVRTASGGRQGSRICCVRSLPLSRSCISAGVSASSAARSFRNPWARRPRRRWWTNRSIAPEILPMGQGRVLRDLGGIRGHDASRCEDLRRRPPGPGRFGRAPAPRRRGLYERAHRDP